VLAHEPGDIGLLYVVSVWLPDDLAHGSSTPLAVSRFRLYAAQQAFPHPEAPFSKSFKPPPPAADWGYLG
jgi:hypothetical protein